jgi:3-(3-hydroxy-phenyl)propionate hydroxylase
MGGAMTHQSVNQYVFDVAVVGLGPVGELAALLLAREGLRVLALERKADMYSRPRVGVLDGEALRTLPESGCTGAGPGDFGAGEQWASRHGRILATTMPTETPQGHPWLSTIYQPLLDQTLREALDSHPGVEMRLGQELIALTEAGGGIQITIRQPDGSLREAHARFVLGCDGANSATREAIDVEMVGPSYEEPWLIVDAKLPEPPAQLPYRRFTMDPDGPRMTARLAAGNQRWERLVMPGEDREEMLRPSVAPSDDRRARRPDGPDPATIITPTPPHRPSTGGSDASCSAETPHTSCRPTAQGLRNMGRRQPHLKLAVIATVRRIL